MTPLETGPEYGSVLLPDSLIPFWKEHKGANLVATEEVTLRFALEELISMGASSIYLRANDALAEHVSGLTPVLAKSVHVVDREDRIQREVDVVMEPIAEEHRLRFERDVLLWVPNGRDEHGVNDALMPFQTALHRFLTGVDYGLQVSMDVVAFQQAASHIRDASRNPESTAMLAHLLGVLSAYKVQNVPSLERAKEDSSRRVQYFHELIEDAMYRKVSASAHGLGFPHRIRRTLIELRRAVQKMVTSEPYKGIFDMGIKQISAALPVPALESSTASSFFRTRYLPPSVPVLGLFRKAKERWEKVATEEDGKVVEGPFMLEDGDESRPVSWEDLIFEAQMYGSVRL